MTVSIRTRFEVFKRDRFTCHYCGRTPPTVLLEVDHIIPRAAGGSDAIENLITACQECNRGKSGNLLEEGTAPTVSRDVIAELAERVEQAKAYAELVVEMRSIEVDAVQQVIDAWARAFEAVSESRDDGAHWVLPEGERWPRRRSIRTILARLPLHRVLEAVEITAAWSEESSDRACRYFYGVCWRRIRGDDEPGPAGSSDAPAGADEVDVQSWIDYGRMEAANEVVRLRGELGDREDEIRDLKINVQRLRDELRRDG